MKAIINFITEKLRINKNMKIDQYAYHPKDKHELENIVKKLIDERGINADLNDIDTSNVTDMSGLFLNSKFNGDISEWDVSNVENMTLMFRNSDFNGDIEKWNVKKVKVMGPMFSKSPLEKNPPSWYKKK